MSKIDRRKLGDALRIAHGQVPYRKSSPYGQPTEVRTDPSGAVTVNRGQPGDRAATVQYHDEHAEGDSAERIIVDHRALAATVKAGPEVVAVTAAEDGSATVDGDGTHTLGASEYDVIGGPILAHDAPHNAEDGRFRIDLADWPNLASIAGHAGTDDRRPVLTGIHFDPSGHAVGTDSYRLAYAKLHDKPPHPVILPADVVATAAKEQNGEYDAMAVVYPQAVRLFYNVNRGGKRSPRTYALTVTTRTVEGKYPDWRQLVGGRREPRWSAMFDGAELSAALDKMPTLGRYDGVATTLDMTADDGPAVVSAQRDGHGVTVNVPYSVALDKRDEATDFPGHVDSGHAEPRLYNVNPRYLADAVDACTGATGGVRINSHDSLKPITVQAGNGPNVATPDKWKPGTIAALVMPVRQ